MVINDVKDFTKILNERRSNSNDKPKSIDIESKEVLKESCLGLCCE